jgi:lysophospholipase L1-like esterase
LGAKLSPVSSFENFIMLRSLVLLLVAAPLFAQDSAADPFAKWEKSIAEIEARLQKSPPKKGGIAFIGSSSIRLWNLDKSFPDLQAVNLGFGGSEIRDSTHFAPRLLLPLKPKVVVFYAGDNDIAKKRTPEQVRDDFQAFVKVVHDSLPKTRVLYIPVKPSVARWSQFDTQKKANAYVQAICAKNDLLTYVDIVTPMLGTDGQPIPELFVKDGLHLSEKGYEGWNSAIRANLQ